jgi:plasmid stabilization system protein ParE
MNDLDAIYEYIASDSAIYAKRVIDRIIQRSNQISSFPYSGRKTPELNQSDIREIIEGSYRIIYRIKIDTIEILTVLHGARLLSESLFYYL